MMVSDGVSTHTQREIEEIFFSRTFFFYYYLKFI